MNRQKTLGSALAAAALAVAGVATAALGGTADAAEQPASTQVSALGDSWYAAAPYLMPLDNNPPSATAIMDATGLRAFQLAFILAPNGGGCTATWGGTSAVSADTAVGGIINAIRAKGGDVSASVGGYGGTKLGQTCADAGSTAAAYQTVITKYQLKAIDLDLEEPEYENTAAIANEVGAAKILQQNNPGLFISITTAANPTAGTGYFGQQMLNQAKAIGFTPNNYSIMPFDGGFNGAAGQITALTAFNGILRTTFGWDEATAYAHEGFSGMNGRSDTGEFFYQSDFQTVHDFATSHHMGRFTFWSLNRDRQCPTPNNNGATSGVCSSVPQADWDFARFSVRFAGATPPTTTTPPTTPPTTTPPSGGGCSSVPAWSSTAVYTNGNEVSYRSHRWLAKWWTQNETPGTTGEWGVWTDEGTC